MHWFWRALGAALMGMLRRLRIVQLAFLLFAGLFLNLLVVLYAEGHGDVRVSIGWMPLYSGMPYGPRARWPRTPPYDWPAPNEFLCYVERSGLHLKRETVVGYLPPAAPSDARAHPVSSVPPVPPLSDSMLQKPGPVRMNLTELGWPWPAMSRWHYLDERPESIASGQSSGKWVAVGAYHTTSNVTGPWRAYELLAVRPVWSGLLGNTIVYAGVLWLLMVHWHLLRRLRRLERGLCPHCGYSLTGNTSGVCPECGTATASPQRSPTA